MAWNNVNSANFTDASATHAGTVPYSARLTPTRITMECWMHRPTWASGGAGCVISKTQNGGYNLAFGASNVSASVWLNGAYKAPSASTASLTPGWHHFAVTCDGRYTRLYIDGTQAAVVDAGGTYNITYSVNNAFIIGNEAGTGATNDNSNPLKNAYVDEVRIWNYARTADDIKKYMRRKLAGTESGLMGYWDFDNVQGLVAYDRTANLACTLSGGAILASGSLDLHSGAEIGVDYSTAYATSGTAGENGLRVTPMLPSGEAYQFMAEIDGVGEIIPWTTYTEPISQTLNIPSESLSLGNYTVTLHTVDGYGITGVKKFNLRVCDMVRATFSAGGHTYKWDGTAFVESSEGNSPQEVMSIPSVAYQTLPYPITVDVVSVSGNPTLRVDSRDDVTVTFRAGDYKIQDGTYTSPTLDIGYLSKFQDMVVNFVANGQTASIETRTYRNGAWSEWVILNADNTVASPEGVRFQYRFVMSTTDGVTTPKLTSVLLNYIISDKEILDASMARIAEDLKQTKIALAKEMFYNGAVRSGQRNQFNNIVIDRLDELTYIEQLSNVELIGGEVKLIDSSKDGFIVLDHVNIPSYSYYTMAVAEYEGRLETYLSFDYGEFDQTELDSKYINPESVTNVRVKFVLKAGTTKLLSVAVLC